MPRIPFQKPRKGEWEILTDRYGRRVAEPFGKRSAPTVGSAPRRPLLNLEPGSGVPGDKIDRVRSADDAISEDKASTSDVVLIRKNLAIQVRAGQPRTVRLDLSEPRTVTVAHI